MLLIPKHIPGWQIAIVFRGNRALERKASFYESRKLCIKGAGAKRLPGGSFVALGYVNLFYRWDFGNAEANFRKAITMEPNNEEARLALAMYYRIIGDIDRMFHHTKAASKIAPVSLPVLLQHGFSFCLLGNHEKAIEIFKRYWN